MSVEMTAEEVAIMIRARQLFREKGLAPNADISEICQAAGISRKTGYQWAEKHAENVSEQKKPIENELAQIQEEYARLKKEFDQISLENRGRKLAWEIHGVDAYLASKKSTMSSRKKKEL
jgi:gas vesicle protein